ncbi:AAA family ATPase [Corynebacterium sp. AOP40-9SA-29]|uniref:AAA family ATPase n=1 Tax=Corynebacterium sp. AOP40-9SA-29 TaxID=3457677 RepID=UPI004034991D
MLIELTLSNFRSFRGPTTLAMRSSREQNHRDRLPRIESRYRMNVNPVAAIYGANASGKTNIAHALRYLRNVVVNQRDDGVPLPQDPFRLDKEYADIPTEFSIMFTDDDDVMFNYYLSILHGKVVSEELYKILSTKEVEIFTREVSPSGSTLTFGDDIRSEFVRKVVRRASDNTPIPTMAAKMSPLNHSVDETGDDEDDRDFLTLATPFTWLSRVTVVGPDSMDASIGLHLMDRAYPSWINALKSIDAGITGSQVTEITPEDAGVTEEELAALTDGLKEGKTTFSEKGANVLSVTLVDGEPVMSRHSLVHGSGSAGTALDWADESDGTKRAFSLFPALQFMAQYNTVPRVVVLDEIDRSLHTELSRKLISAFLDACTPETRSQLILTTHDVMLMDVDLFRRDEIWVVEKTDAGASELRALSEYEGVRNGSDLRRSYLNGRFGGTPSIPAIDYSDGP